MLFEQIQCLIDKWRFPIWTIFLAPVECFTQFHAMYHYMICGGVGRYGNILRGFTYTGARYSVMKGSVCFVMEFAFPPFPPPLPSSANFKTKQGQKWQKLSYQNILYQCTSTHQDFVQHRTWWKQYWFRSIFIIGIGAMWDNLWIKCWTWIDSVLRIASW